MRGITPRFGNDYSELVADAFRATFARTGGRIVADVSYASGETDFVSQISFIKASDASGLSALAYDAAGLAETR